MKKRIIKKPVDSIKKRKSRRDFVLDVKMLSRKISKSEAFILSNQPKNYAIKRSYIGYLQALKKSIDLTSQKQGTRKISAIFLILGLVWLGIIQVGRTAAYFIDIESSQGNSISAGTLDFSLVSDTENFMNLESISFNINQNSTSEAERHVTIINEGNLPFDYYAGAENISGDPDFCGDLVITAAREGEIIFHGYLFDFIPPNSPKVALTGDRDEWSFQMDPASGEEHPNKNCSFDLVFRGWQTGEEIDLRAGQFSDEEELANSLDYAGVVLNEFLPNPSGSEAFGEWVELYNNSNTPVDTAGWALYDSNDNHELVIDDCFTRGESTIIQGKEFLVIYRKNKNKCSSDFALNNSKDTLRLYNARVEDGGILMDSYSYDNNDLSEIDPTPGEGNDDPSGSEEMIKNNNKEQTDKTYARYPDGVGPWFDPIPTPGKPNILESENENKPAEIPEYKPVKVDDDTDDVNKEVKKDIDKEKKEDVDSEGDSINNELDFAEEQSEITNEGIEAVDEDDPPKESTEESLNSTIKDEIENNETAGLFENNDENSIEESLGGSESDSEKENLENIEVFSGNLDIDIPDNNSEEPLILTETAEEQLGSIAVE